MTAEVEGVLDDIAARDWDALRLKLHPYLHWGQPDGTVLRGRRRVLEWLESAPVPAPPRMVELRDGQIYRWKG